MESKFSEESIDKIAKYLKLHKCNLPKLYQWNSKLTDIKSLIDNNLISEGTEKQKLDEKTDRFEKDIYLKEILGRELKSKKLDVEQFKKLCYALPCR